MTHAERTRFPAPADTPIASPEVDIRRDLRRSHGPWRLRSAREGSDPKR